MGFRLQLGEVLVRDSLAEDSTRCHAPVCHGISTGGLPDDTRGVCLFVFNDMDRLMLCFNESSARSLCACVCLVQHEMFFLIHIL